MVSPVRTHNRLLGELSEIRSQCFSTYDARWITDLFSNSRVRRDSIRELHGHFIRTHQHRNSNAMAQVIKSYSLSPASIDKARSAFFEIVKPTLPVWNHMIRGLAQSDSPADALDVFIRMCELGLSVDNLTLIFMCKACARVSDGLYGRRVHARVLKLGFGSYLYVCNSLINMYGSCGYLGSSRRVFDEMDDKDLVSWNSLMCAYSQCAKYNEVLALFDLMRVENVTGDAVTMVKVILTCKYLGEFQIVDSLVEYIDNNGVEIDVYLGNILIDVYGSRGSFVLPRSFFDRMTEKNAVSWNAMIIAAAKSGHLVEAKKLFDEMPHKDVISWTSMITGYAQANRNDEAITLFLDMVAAKMKPDQVTLATVLSACGRAGRLDVGKAIHDHTRESDIKPDSYVVNALIDMYCKCGSVGNALKLFHDTKEKDSVSWTSVISGLAVNGDSQHALELFSQMLKEGVRPSHATFVGILLACVHAGLVDKGLHSFASMQKDYGLVPEMRHYGCMVDLFCRAGYLSRAYEFIKNMPICPDAVLWRILLSACKVHDDLVLAQIASRKLLELDPSNGLNYVLSSNSYASAERWEDASKMRELMDQGDFLMPLGLSCIEATHEIAKTARGDDI